MAKIDYQNTGLTQLKLIRSEHRGLGWANLVESDEFVDECVAKRMAFVSTMIPEIHEMQGDYSGTEFQRNRCLMTYEHYLKTIKSVDTIAGKIAETEQDVSVPYRRLTPQEDAIVARIVKNKTGYDPSGDWKKVDKINELKRKLWTQYDAVTLQFVRNYDPAIDTADRDGYLRFVQRQDPKFFDMLADQIAVEPEPREAIRHAYITGGSGSGKSELLKVLINTACRNPDHEAVVVIDPHGDLVDQIAHWPMFAETHRLMYIDPFMSGEHVPPFNPLSVPETASMQEREVIAQQLVSVFEQLLKGSSGDGLTVNMRTVLLPCILTLTDRPKSTLADLKRFMDDARNDDLVALGRQSKRRSISEFFAYDFVTDASLQSSKNAVSRKLQSLFTTYAFDEVINSTQSIDFVKAVDEGKVILFNLAKGRLGSEASEAFGKLIVASIQGLALRRVDTPRHERRQLNLFIDECQNYISPATIEILEEARKYGVNMTLAQQVVGRGMSSEVTTVVMNNTNIKIAGFTSKDTEMAKTVGKTLQDVQQLPTGEFWMKVGNGGTFKLKARSDLADYSHSMSDEEWEKCKLKFLRHYRRLEDQAPNPLAEAPPKPPEPGERDLI